MPANIHIGLYAALLRIYPEPFFSEFGTEMLEVFSDRVNGARGSGQRLRLWIRELVSFPMNVLRAWLPAGAGDPLPVPSIIAGAVALLALSWSAAELLTTIGLFSISSVVALLCALVCGGCMSGLAAASGRARRGLFATAILGAFSLLALAYGADRNLQHQTMSWALPGIRLDTFETRSDADAARLLAAVSRNGFARVRTIVTQKQEQPVVVRVLRTGGVDGLYVLLCLAVTIAAAYGGHRAGHQSLFLHH